MEQDAQIVQSLALWFPKFHPESTDYLHKLICNQGLIVCLLCAKYYNKHKLYNVLTLDVPNSVAKLDEKGTKAPIF